ncbi:hypothetical protein [Natrarchaeobius oligotrophus]|nr:hypothetical protein [Natrarchaeobius chitinivorans]
MRMNRRNVLLGLGTIVAGGGAAIGTGAFSQVEATRTADISVADDSSALLTLRGDTDSQLIDEDGGTLGIDQNNINLNGTTRVDEAIEIENNGGQQIELGVTLASGGDVDDATARSIFSLEFNESASTDTPTGVSDEDDLIGDTESGNEWELGDGDEVTVDLVIDTTQATLNDGDDVLDEMTFTATDAS